MVGKGLNRFRSDFEFDVLFFELNSNLTENTNSIGSNVENDAVRYGIFLYHFDPYLGRFFLEAMYLAQIRRFFIVFNFSIQMLTSQSVFAINTHVLMVYFI